MPPVASLDFLPHMLHCIIVFSKVQELEYALKSIPDNCVVPAECVVRAHHEENGIVKRKVS